MSIRTGIPDNQNAQESLAIGPPKKSQGNFSSHSQAALAMLCDPNRTKDSFAHV